ncbi:MAG: pectate lyase [Holophagales bacterium]|nr:pectate lyase [Holophagales bacterium]
MRRPRPLVGALGIVRTGSIGLLVALSAAAPAASALPARVRPAGVDLVVARDGSGDCATIQAALDALPAMATRTRVVLVRNGIYREKLLVTKSRVAIVGEDREKTRIEYAVLRREWRKTNPDDWGAAVVNVGDDVTDLLLANLTIRNDHGSRTGDHDHQFAIRSGGSSTRIVLLHANVLADGGDTVSLWNAFTGMTYHASCTFEGWVDFVCPRGSSYVTNSRFVAHNMTAAIWHDGSKDRDHRFVVRSSRFDGDPGFPLGRNNRDGQFTLLDCAFSAAMADQPIYQPSAPESYSWEPRAFFHGCRGDDGDFPWFRDNLRDADFSPSPAEITPEWTFCGQWDPEGTMPPVLPFASVPRPRDEAKDVPLFGSTLRWVGARGATAHELFFGPGDDLPRVARLEPGTTNWPTGPLRAGTRYAWRVDAIGPDGRVRDETWSFTAAPRPFRIALAGDSTVTERQGWGTGFAALLRPGAAVSNHARGGRSTKSYVEEGSWQEVLSGRPDVVLIQFGHNDAPGKGPERETDAFTTYRENLARMIDEARAVGARPVLLTSLTRRYLDEAGCVRSDLGFYADAARTVALERRVPLLDLHRLSIEVVDTMSPAEVAALGVPKEDGTLDRTHLSPAGSALFGALVAEELGRLAPDLAPAFDLSRAPAPEAAPAAASSEGETAEPNVRSSAIRTLAPLLEKPAAWFSSPEAALVGENLLLWQRANGGWPKDLDMALSLGPEQKATLVRRKDRTDTTIDNGATHTQIRFLARLFSTARDERFRAGALRGLEFLLAAQYPNGGWPQFFPLRGDYSRDVTFNDGAMTGALGILLDVSEGREPFGWVDRDLRERSRRAVGRGVEAILAAQVVVGEKRTAWGAQHDAVTLAPSSARTFEPVALASSESVGVVRFLMSLPAPSREIVDAVDSAVAWLRSVRIDGLRVERRKDPALPGGIDTVATPDPSAPPVWARFYEIGTNRPLFSGRDGVVKSRLAEIEHERRTGYAWYVDAPASLLSKDYPAWKAKHSTEVPR